METAASIRASPSLALEEDDAEHPELPKHRRERRCGEVCRATRESHRSSRAWRRRQRDRSALPAGAVLRFVKRALEFSHHFLGEPLTGVRAE